MKSNFNKILSLSLTLILCVYFTSCNSPKKSGNKNVSAATGWAIGGFKSKKSGFKYNTNYKIRVAYM